MKDAAKLGTIIAGLIAAPAMAACPPPMAGDTAAEIRGNSERLVCLQNELATNIAQRRLQMQMDAINSRLRDLDLQRRLDSLPQPPAIIVQPPISP